MAGKYGCFRMARGLLSSCHYEDLRERRRHLENPTYLVLSRMVSQTNAMDVIANNIANASTPGFKATNMQFSGYVTPSGSTVPGGGSLAYASAGSTWRDTASGAVQNTGSPLDLAITGDGYFQVKTPNGNRLTRDGAFGLLPDGTLATASGAQVLDTSDQPITVPPNAGTLTITADGIINDENGQIGQIGVVDVADPQSLTAAGDNQFISSQPTTAATRPGIVQGALEQSNVSPVLMITKMMETSQDFQFNTQFLQAEQTRQMSAISQILGQS
jgi:flagellar basal-body rod protein FlgF